MLKATIAGRRVALIGCDAMACAQYFSLFPPTDGDPQFTMQVDVQDSLPLPIGKPCERIGGWRIVRDDAGNTVNALVSGELMLINDERFEHVHLYLRTDHPEREPLHYLQVMQAFSYHLQHIGGCLLHGAGMELYGDGVLLCGKSGVGKSTMARLLTAAHPTAHVLCEESTALVEESTGMMLYGTPFCGKDSLCMQGSAPLRVIVLLRRADRDRVYTASPTEALYELMSGIPRPPFEREICELSAERLMRVVQQTPIVIFENTGTASSAQVLSAALTEQGLFQKKDR